MATTPSQKIGVSLATIIGMNAMIGAGIFVIPTTLASNAGPASIVTFIFVAFATWCMAQSIARVAQLFPQEGSFYTYARQWGGHTVGLITVACYLIGMVIAMGLLTHSAGEHLVRYIPSMSTHTLGLFSLIALTILNMCDISLSTLAQQILIALTVFPLLATTAICFTKADPANLLPFAPYGFKPVWEQTRNLAFAFFGFEAIASLFTIIKSPEKNLPRAITYSLLIVSGLYFIFIVSVMMAVPFALFSQYPGPVSNALSHVFPNSEWIIEGIHISSLFAILGTLHSMIWASSSLFLSFVKKIRLCSTQKLLASGIVSHKTAVFCTSLTILTSFMLLTDGMFFNLTALFLITAYVCAMIPLLTIPGEWKSGQNIITLTGIATAALIFYFAAENCLIAKQIKSDAQTTIEAQYCPEVTKVDLTA